MAESAAMNTIMQAAMNTIMQAAMNTIMQAAMNTIMQAASITSMWRSTQLVWHQVAIHTDLDLECTATQAT
jgi:hypothetical protein